MTGWRGMTCPYQRFGVQHFAEPLGEAGRAKNLSKEQERGARVVFLSDGANGVRELRIRIELFRTRIEPRVDRGVRHAQLGLQFAGIARRIIHQEPRINAEEACQQLS